MEISRIYGSIVQIDDDAIFTAMFASLNVSIMMYQEYLYPLPLSQR